ncbi:MAG: hypothetical protein V1856_01895 [Candidatus Liptonbacteria bacterium]
MKNIVWVGGIVVALLLALVVPVTAQTFRLETTTTYQVAAGDNLWRLKGTQWRALLPLNPHLESEGRVEVRSEDLVIVRIYPGETLVIPSGLGIEETLGIEEASSPRPTVRAVRQAAPAAGMYDDRIPWWVLLFVALAILVLVVALAVAWLIVSSVLARKRQIRERAAQLVQEQVERNRQLQAERERLEREQAEQARRDRVETERQARMRRDPVTAGPAYVPGGIEETERQRLRNFFDSQARARWAQSGIPSLRGQPTRVGPIESGFLSDEGYVGFRGRNPELFVLEAPLAGYQARYRYPDGTEEVLQSVAGCMNPVVIGEEMRSFTFTVERPVVPASRSRKRGVKRPPPPALPATA